MYLKYTFVACRRSPFALSLVAKNRGDFWSWVNSADDSGEEELEERRFIRLIVGSDRYDDGSPLSAVVLL